MNVRRIIKPGMKKVATALAALIFASVFLYFALQDENENSVIAALASGQKILRIDEKVYEIQCTGKGEANAFEIRIDDNGEREVSPAPLFPYPLSAATCAAN